MLNIQEKKCLVLAFVSTMYNLGMFRAVLEVDLELNQHGARAWLRASALRLQGFISVSDIPME